MTYQELAKYAEKKLAGKTYITLYEEPVAVSDSEEFWNSVDDAWNRNGEDF